MKITAGRADAFVRRPPPEVVAVLLYGPDQGLVRERALALGRLVIETLDDPFRVAELTGATLKDDPARLADEAAALSFTGGRRFVRVRDAGDAVTKVVQAFLESPTGEALVVVEAGELPPRSTLRKLFEGADNAAAIGCYMDDAEQLERVIVETLSHHGLRVGPDVLAFLAGHLGSDRVVTRTELEKLALYKGGPGTVTLEDALASIADAAATSLDDVINAAAQGDAAAADRALTRALAEGTNPVTMLRSATRHFQRLHLAVGLMERGRPQQQAMSALKPPVLFMHQKSFQAQMRLWRSDALATALDLLTDAEADCKTTGYPATAVCGRALLRVAQVARRAGQRR